MKISREKAFEMLAAANGLHIEKMGNLQRAWLGTYDYIMALNKHSSFDQFQVANTIIHGKFMNFAVYNSINTKLYNELDAHIKDLLERIKKYRIEKKLEKMQEDF
jgi:hypothetical protein